jgi:hypothetical protein
MPLAAFGSRPAEPAEASLAMPTGGHAGFAGVAVCSAEG